MGRWTGLKRLEAVHHEETSGHLALRRLCLPAVLAKRDRRMAHRLVKQGAERSQALEAHFEANVRDAQLVRAQEFFGSFDAPLDQVLVRSLIKCLPEQTQKMKARKTGVTGNLFQIEREVVTKIDKLSRAVEPFEYFRRCHWRVSWRFIDRRSHGRSI